MAEAEKKPQKIPEFDKKKGKWKKKDNDLFRELTPEDILRIAAKKKSEEQNPMGTMGTGLDAFAREAGKVSERNRAAWFFAGVVSNIAVHVTKLITELVTRSIPCNTCGEETEHVLMSEALASDCTWLCLKCETEYTHLPRFGSNINKLNPDVDCPPGCLSRDPGCEKISDCTLRNKNMAIPEIKGDAEEQSEEVEQEIEPASTDIELVIDPEFESFLPELRPDEFAKLEEKIIRQFASGIIPVIDTWNGTIIDGHHTYKICKKNNIPYQIREHPEFSTREEIIEFIVLVHVGRRNMIERDFKYYLGGFYLKDKKPVGGPKGQEFTGNQNVELDRGDCATGAQTAGSNQVAEGLAKKFSRSKRTVYKAANYREVVDVLASSTNTSPKTVRENVDEKDILEYKKLPAEAQQQVNAEINDKLANNDKPAKAMKKASKEAIKKAIRQSKQDKRRDELKEAAKRREASLQEGETRPPSDQTILQGDMIYADIASDSIDLIITSPPYNLDMQYGEGSNDAKDWNLYLAFTEAYLIRLYSLLKDDGRLCLNIPLDSNKNGNVPFDCDIIQVARKVGFHYYSRIIWNEGNTSTPSPLGSYASPKSPCVFARVEIILLLYKKSWTKLHDGQPTIINGKDFEEWVRGVWNFHGETKANSGHPAAFPVELPRRCIELFAWLDDVVLDPFLGSGTTLIACAMTKRKGIGIEINPDYCKLARARVDLAEEELYKKEHPKEKSNTIDENPEDFQEGD